MKLTKENYIEVAKSVVVDNKNNLNPTTKEIILKGKQEDEN